MKCIVIHSYALLAIKCTVHVNETLNKGVHVCSLHLVNLYKSDLYTDKE